MLIEGSSVCTMRSTKHILEEVITDKYELIWASILCDNGDVGDFLKVYESGESSKLGIEKYREQLLSVQKVNDDLLDGIMICYQRNDDELVIQCLERLFLEPVGLSLHRKFNNSMNNDKNNIKSLYKIHMEDKNKHLMQILIEMKYA